MPNALDLPHFVLNRLGIDSYKIHQGVYPVHENPDFIRVDF